MKIISCAQLDTMDRFPEKPICNHSSLGFLGDNKGYKCDCGKVFKRIPKGYRTAIWRGLYVK